MQKTLGWTMLLVGVFILFVSYAFPMITLIVDNTAPIFGPTVPATGVTYTSLDKLTAYVRDPESGIASVTGKIDTSSYSLSFVGSIPVEGTVFELWQYMFSAPFATSGLHTFDFTAVNKAGLSKTYSGTFTIYTKLQGKWFVNAIEITSSSQTITSTRLTVNFKFAKTAGVEDSQITATVWKGTAKLLDLTYNSANPAAHEWMGSYTFTAGTYVLDLKAFDGTNYVTMSVLYMQVGEPFFELPQLNMLQIVGLASTGIGLVLILFGKPR